MIVKLGLIQVLSSPCNCITEAAGNVGSWGSVGEGPAASSVKEGRRAGNSGNFGAGAIFSEAGGGGRVVGWGRGRLAWVLGQRDADPGAVSPAVGLCPQHTLSAVETQHWQG